MKRPPWLPPKRICVLLVLLGGGAIVNVAVAWGCVAFMQSTTVEADTAASESALRDFIEFDAGSHHMTQFNLEWSRGVGVCVVSGNLSQVNFGDDGADVTVVLLTYAGWPSISLRGGFGFGALTFSEFFQSQPQWVRSETNAYRVFPSGPIWPGFAINTIFYAAILWGLFAVPFALRRRRRIKRGLCVKCGYDLRGRTGHTSANICPECGTAAPSSKSIPP